MGGKWLANSRLAIIVIQVLDGDVTQMELGCLHVNDRHSVTDGNNQSAILQGSIRLEMMKGYLFGKASEVVKKENLSSFLVHRSN